MDDTVTLRVQGGHGDASVEVDVMSGGRVARLEISGEQFLVDPDRNTDPRTGDPDRHADDTGETGETGDPRGRDATSTAWGSYPMAPWAGRIRHGMFRLLGNDHELALNHQDGTAADPSRRHAIHGTVFSQPWTIEEQSATSISLRCPLSPPEQQSRSLRNFGWTFGGTARQTIELLDGQLRCDLSVEVDHSPDRASSPFLAEVGWHPWFRKPSSISFHPDAMYERDDIGLPTGQLVAPSTGPWDDCFVNTAPVTLNYAPNIDTTTVSTLTLSSDCDHWVVYDMPAHATCVEPQSGPPDAFNVRPRLVTATHPLRRTMNIAW